MEDRQKHLQPEFSWDQHAYNKIWFKLIENWGSSSLLKILTSEILQSAPNDPKPNSRNQASKVPYMGTVVPRVINFRPFCSTISPFQDIPHFRIFPLTPMLKFQSGIKFLNFGRLSIPVYTIAFYSLVNTLFIIKFGSDRMKTGGGVAF